MPPATFQPLTKEQYEKARGAGFSHDQILINEEKRKGSSAASTAPSAVPPKEGFGQALIGAAKSVAEVPVGAAQGAEWLMNQTAGRVVSAARGQGLVPLPKKELTYSTESDTGARIHDAIDPKGFSQKAGYYAGTAAQLISPYGTYKALTKAPAVARSIEAVTPKLTAGRIRDAYEGGRATVQGLLGRVGVKPDARTIRAGEEAAGLAKGKVAAKDANAVYGEIGREGDLLETTLKGMEIQPTVYMDELTGLFKTATDEIAQNVNLGASRGATQETAKIIFDKFVSLLPKGRDVTASDILTARKALDRWVEAQPGGDKALDAAAQTGRAIALRAIRQGGNKLLIEKAPGVPVAESLQRQTRLYDALEGIATKGPAEIGTTAVGRYLNRHPYQKKAVEGLAGGLLPLGIGGYLYGKAVGDQ